MFITAYLLSFMAVDDPIMHTFLDKFAVFLPMRGHVYCAIL